MHGVYLVIQRLGGPIWTRFLNKLRIPNWIQSGIAIGLVYFLTCLAWIYFRAANEPDSFALANQMISIITSFEQFNFGSVINKFWVLKGVLLIGILLLVELVDLYRPLYREAQLHPAFRVVAFASLLWMIAFFGSFGANSFIYFQF